MAPPVNIYTERLAMTGAQYAYTVPANVREIMVQPITADLSLYALDASTPRVEGATPAGVISGAELSDVGVTDWTTYGIDAENDHVIITDGAGGTVDGIYRIASVAAAQITLASAPGDGTCSYSVVRAPFYTLKQNCSMKFIARNSGTDLSGQILYMSGSALDVVELLYTKRRALT